MEVFLQWTPIIDGIELTDQPINLFAKGAVAPMPMIVVRCLSCEIHHETFSLSLSLSLSRSLSPFQGTTSEETVFYIYEAFTSPMSVSLN